jgi:hypothetical protein
MPVELPTDAIEGLLLVQVPPTVASVYSVLVPTHTELVPTIVPADAVELTVRLSMAEAVPHELVTV